MGHRQAYTSNEGSHRKTAKQSAIAGKKIRKTRFEPWRGWELKNQGMKTLSVTLLLLFFAFLVSALGF
jgi:hypothetical protein